MKRFYDGVQCLCSFPSTRWCCMTSSIVTMYPWSNLDLDVQCRHLFKWILSFGRTYVEPSPSLHHWSNGSSPSVRPFSFRMYSIVVFAWLLACVAASGHKVKHVPRNDSKLAQVPPRTVGYFGNWVCLFVSMVKPRINGSTYRIFMVQRLTISRTFQGATWRIWYIPLRMLIRPPARCKSLLCQTKM